MNLQNETIDYGICKRTLFTTSGKLSLFGSGPQGKAFEATHPQVRLIRLGIGDVTRPLPQACIEAMCRAVRELADAVHSTLRAGTGI